MKLTDMMLCLGCFITADDNGGLELWATIVFSDEIDC
jgi:hypothetical protein